MNQTTIDMITDKLKQRIANKTLSLPMLPQVTMQVLSLVNDVNSDAAALAQLIHSDQALAGHVMRIANSAAYSPTTKMASLQQATARLGMQNIADIAMAATMGPKLFQAPGFETMVSTIWRLSLATAVWAREIARLGRRNVESAFLCGLLFQVGKPVVLQAVLEIASECDQSIEPDDTTVWIDQFHKEVGSTLAEHWQLPATVVATIKGVATQGSIEDAEDIIATVKAAQVFSAITVSDRHYDPAILSVNACVVDINLYPDDVQALLEKSAAIHETIEALSL